MKRISIKYFLLITLIALFSTGILSSCITINITPAEQPAQTQEQPVQQVLPQEEPTDQRLPHPQEQLSPYVPSVSPQSSTPEPSPSSGEFVGSINSSKYHYPDCQWAKKIHPDNEIWFSSVADAKAKGYVPCKVCKPPD